MKIDGYGIGVVAMVEGVVAPGAINTTWEDINVVQFKGIVAAVTVKDFKAGEVQIPTTGDILGAIQDPSGIKGATVQRVILGAAQSFIHII